MRVCACVCLPGAVWLQFENVDCFSVAGCAQKVGVGAEGQRTYAHISKIDMEKDIQTMQSEQQPQTFAFQLV